MCFFMRVLFVLGVCVSVFVLLFVCSLVWCGVCEVCLCSVCCVSVIYVCVYLLF